MRSARRWCKHWGVGGRFNKNIKRTNERIPVFILSGRTKGEYHSNNDNALHEFTPIVCPWRISPGSRPRPRHQNVNAHAVMAAVNLINPAVHAGRKTHLMPISICMCVCVYCVSAFELSNVRISTSSFARGR